MRLFTQLSIGLLSGLTIVTSGCSGPSTTTSNEYTAAEVQEIVRLLREDVECRDTRLGDESWRYNNSVELWQAVLGKPEADAYPLWTYQCSDGTVTVRVGTDSGNSEAQYLTINPNVTVVSPNPNAKVDSEALKQTILSIKQRIDPQDSIAFYNDLEKQRLRDQAEQDEDRANENRRLEAERIKREKEGQVQKDRESAEDDFWTLRDTIPVGPEKKAFEQIRADWIKRRCAVITESRENGKLPVREAAFGQKEIDRNLPLPDAETVIAALKDNHPVPVLPSGNEKNSGTSSDPKSQNERNTSPEGLAKRTYWKRNKSGYFKRQADGTWMDFWDTGKSWGPYNEEEVTEMYVAISRSDGNVILRLYNDRIEVRFVSRGKDFEKLYEGGWAKSE